MASAASPCDSQPRCSARCDATWLAPLVVNHRLDGVAAAVRTVPAACSHTSESRTRPASRRLSPGSVGCDEDNGLITKAQTVGPPPRTAHSAQPSGYPGEWSPAQVRRRTHNAWRESSRRPAAAPVSRAARSPRWSRAGRARPGRRAARGRRRSGRRCPRRWSATCARCRGPRRCATRRSGCSIRAFRPGRISWSRSLWKAMKRVSQSGAGSASSAIRSESGRSCRIEREHRSGPGECRALVRGAEGDDGVHPLVTAHPLDVVAGDQTAETVSDHVHLLVARLRGQLLDRDRQVLGGRPDVMGQQAVVERGQIGEPPPAERPLQRREDGVVVDDAVDQQDRRGRRVDRVVHEAALMGTESTQVVPVRLAGSARRAVRAGTSSGAP